MVCAPWNSFVVVRPLQGTLEQFPLECRTRTAPVKTKATHKHKISQVRTLREGWEEFASAGSEAWLARRRAAPPASPARARLARPRQPWSLQEPWQSEAGPGSLTQTAGTGPQAPRAGSLLAAERCPERCQGPGGLPVQPCSLSTGPSVQGPVLRLLELPRGTGPGGGSGLPRGPSVGTA